MSQCKKCGRMIDALDHDHADGLCAYCRFERLKERNHCQSCGAWIARIDQNKTGLCPNCREGG